MEEIGLVIRKEEPRERESGRERDGEWEDKRRGLEYSPSPQPVLPVRQPASVRAQSGVADKQCRVSSDQMAQRSSRKKKGASKVFMSANALAVTARQEVMKL